MWFLVDLAVLAYSLATLQSFAAFLMKHGLTAACVAAVWWPVAGIVSAFTPRPEPDEPKPWLHF